MSCQKSFGRLTQESRTARTVVLKLKTSEFKILTQSHTPATPPSSCQELTAIALVLRERVDLGLQQRYRLVGVGLNNFCEPEVTTAQPVLFELRVYQSAAAAPAGCCFIISSIPFFISLALGSALCVPTIHA